VRSIILMPVSGRADMAVSPKLGSYGSGNSRFVRG
jgi:hypothetical protein